MVPWAREDPLRVPALRPSYRLPPSDAHGGALKAASGHWSTPRGRSGQAGLIVHVEEWPGVGRDPSPAPGSEGPAFLLVGGDLGRVGSVRLLR